MRNMTDEEIFKLAKELTFKALDAGHVATLVDGEKNGKNVANFLKSTYDNLKLHFGKVD
ncbi:hypothetical protein HMPREF9013_1323 [Bulleidia extructa W1219]|uniref:Uncharacterized protein n=1 Tax=Bulleidia extructa W1219 TaxID=679192 RepID=D2MPK6_9FIRM|nr:hypothetical protein [Bulleidia extructa]EFC05618.1 hypothetical protein HMPREF9013_1323 [Bulleidia extructa W1219]